MLFPDPHPKIEKMGKFIHSHTRFEDIVFSPHIRIGRFPPYYSADSLKFVYRVDSIQDILNKLIELETEVNISLIENPAIRISIIVDKSRANFLVDDLKRIPNTTVENDIFKLYRMDEFFLRKLKAVAKSSENTVLDYSKIDIRESSYSHFTSYDKFHKILNTHAPSHFSYKFTDALRNGRVFISYGFRKPSKAFPCSDGVTFKVNGDMLEGERIPLYRYEYTMVDYENASMILGNRDERNGIIILPEGIPFAKLHFIVEKGETDHCDWAFWGRISFEQAVNPIGK
jgi:hypothetical protein